MAEHLPSPAMERDLSDRLIESDPEAIATFYTLAHPSTFTTACGLTTDPTSARAWTESVLVGLLDDLKAGRFEWRQGGSFWSWIRQRGWFRMLDLYCRGVSAAGHSPGALDFIRERTGGGDPALEFERVGFRILLDGCIDQLAHEHHRRSLSLLLLDQASYPDIAQRMGVPLTTVHRWTKRARLLVRESLADKLGLRVASTAELADEAHAGLQRLVLVSEELHDSELATADAHRNECVTCRTLLEQVRRIEVGARLRGALPPLDDDAAVVSSAHAEARHSLAALMKRPELRGPVPEVIPLPPPEPSMPPLRRWLLWVPAAAMIAVVVAALGSRPTTESVLRAGTRVVHAGPTVASSPPEFATGDAFAIDLDLVRPSRVMIAHLQPGGGATMLVPASGELAPVLAAGPQRIGEAGNPVWTFTGPPGRDAFLVIPVEGWGSDVDELRQELRKLGRAPEDSRVELARRRIADRWGPVQVVEVNRGH